MTMNDEQLIQLVQETPPEELSVEEIELLRARASKSPELRNALAAHLHFDQFLNGTLSRLQLSVDQVLRHGQPAASSRSRFYRWRWGLAALLVLVSAAGALVTLNRRAANEAVLIAEKARQEAAASKAEPTNPTAAPTAKSEPAAMPETPPAAVPVAVTAADKQREAARWLAKVNGPARSFQESCFDEFSDSAVGVSLPDLSQWWETVKGRQQPVQAGRKKIAGQSLQGLFKLRPAWTAGTTLRLALVDGDQVRLCFWNGNEGLALQYYDRQGQTWAAYTVRRKSPQQEAELLALVATDGERFRRTGRGAIELRYQTGRLILSRGDILLLSAPLEKQPDAVTLETVQGQALLAGMALVPSPAFPLATSEQKPEDVVTADQMKWQSDLPTGAVMKNLADGGVELSGQDLAKPAWILTKIDEPGLREVTFELEDPQPGTSICLGSADGPPRLHLSFYGDRVATDRKQKTDATVLAWGAPVERQRGPNLDKQRPLPLLGQRQWVRLLVGAGAIKCWISADGIQWARVLDPIRFKDSLASSVGVCCGVGKTPHAIKLRSVAIRRLPHIEGLVPAALRGRALALSDARDMGNWLQRVLEGQPPDVDAVTWRIACAVRTLAAGADGEVARAVLRGLLSDLRSDARLAQNPLGSLEERLALLDELSLVADTSDPAAAAALVDSYQHVGLEELRRGARRPYTRIRKSLMESPLWTQTPVDAMPWLLVRSEILQLVYADAWEDLQMLCRQLQFFSASAYGENSRLPEREQTMAWADWAEALAQRNRPTEQAQHGLVIPATWRHPLVVQFGKEGYNVLAELEAALAGGAFKDACQIISSVTAQQAIGLLPNSQDPALLVSLPGAVALAMHDHTPLRQTMQDQFGPLGQLRLRQAIGDDDPEAVEALTIQFYGTRAAADAHVWLGDRAMARGDFVRAEGRYRSALAQFSSGDQREIQARIRLAAAMLGREAGEPVADDLQLGTTQLSPDEFEKLVSDMRARHAAQAASGEAAAMSAPSLAAVVPPPGSFALEPWAKLGEQFGRDPNANVHRNLDWTAYQLAVTIAPPRMIVSNRFQVAAYELESGKQQWTGTLEEPGRTHQWSLVPMRPVVAGSTIYVRRLLNTGPELVALDVESGKLLWRSRRGESVASDPVFVAGKLLAATLNSSSQEILQVSMTSFDVATGQIISQQPLAQFRGITGRELPCQIAVAADSLLVTAAGCVLACDLEGQPSWLRRETWLGGLIDPRSAQQHYQPPVVSGEWCFVAQPGVPSVTCLQSRSGRMRWQQSCCDLVRILGLVESRLLLQTSSGVVALAADTGKPLWYYDAEDLLEAQLLDDRGRLLISQLEPVGVKQARTRLMWLDSATGKEQGRSTLDGWQSPMPRLGPAAAYRDRLWLFAGLDDRDPKRQILEVKALSKTPGEDLALLALPAAWTTHLGSALQGSDAVLPGWTLLQSEPATKAIKAGLQTSAGGEQAGFVTIASVDSPASWARLVTLPPDEPIKLRIKAGAVGPDAWTLVVRAGNEQLHSSPIASSGTDKFGDVEVDLSKLAGQTVWLFVSQTMGAEAKRGTRSAATWKSLQLVYPK
jgi:outer membrane protein assembly factor BamB